MSSLIAGERQLYVIWGSHAHGPGANLSANDGRAYRVRPQGLQSKSSESSSIRTCERGLGGKKRKADAGQEGPKIFQSRVAGFLILDVLVHSIFDRGPSCEGGKN
jgi:hypothetical protein